MSTEATIITSEEYVIKFTESRRILEKINEYNYPSSNVFEDGLTEHIIHIYKLQTTWWFKLY